jgi:hypothetical protein
MKKTAPNGGAVQAGTEISFTKNNPPAAARQPDHHPADATDTDLGTSGAEVIGDRLEIPDFLLVQNRTPVTPAARPEADMTTKAKSWRDVLPVHPAAELFPLMSPEELKDLGCDIRRAGLRARVALWKESVNSPTLLLDGRNRLDAIEAVGIALNIDDSSGSHTVIKQGNDIASGLVSEYVYGVDPYAYVISANIRRRHLNAEQRQHLLITLIARAPEKSDRQIGAEIGVDHKTIARARTKGEDVGSIPHVETRTDTKGRKQPAKKPKRTPEVDEATMAKRAAMAEEIRALMAKREAIAEQIMAEPRAVVETVISDMAREAAEVITEVPEPVPNVINLLAALIAESRRYPSAVMVFDEIDVAKVPFKIADIGRLRDWLRCFANAYSDQRIKRFRAEAEERRKAEADSKDAA